MSSYVSKSSCVSKCSTTKENLKIVLAFLTSSSGAPDLLYGCLLGKVTNLATYRPSIKLNLAIQALGKLRPTFLGDPSNPS